MNGDRLTGLDSSFLHLERGGAHMHVASTLIFEGPPPQLEEFRSHLAARLHLVPRFRQRLRFVPYGQGRPVWVDDPRLNLDYHLRYTALPAPGSEEQLRTLAARVFSQRLDRSKPLWEMWLVGGLEGGRFAIVGKSHHCLVDGVSGVDVNTVIFDTEREPPQAPPPPRWEPGPEPTDAELLTRALAERLVDPREVVRSARALLRRPRQALGALREAGEAVASLAGVGFAAPPSLLNLPIGSHRRFAWVRADLGQLRRVKDSHGGTVNDVVLAVVTGALGRYLRSRGHSTSELELRALVPISVRGSDERGALGNRVAAMMAPLPVWCTDPLERLRLIGESMQDLKQTKQAVGAELLTEATDFTPPTVAAQAARLQPRQRLFNLVVTNVPGPQFPLYLLGRRLRDVFPMVPLAGRQALSVGIMSYDGAINFGLVGDYEAMAGLDSFAADLEASLRELSATVPASAAPAQATPAGPSAAR
jgi:WS/DGAT/MGAT family acyltransferase